MVLTELSQGVILKDTICGGRLWEVLDVFENQVWMESGKDIILEHNLVGLKMVERQ